MSPTFDLVQESSVAPIEIHLENRQMQKCRQIERFLGFCVASQASDVGSIPHRPLHASLPGTVTDSPCIQGAFCRDLTWTGFAETKHGTSPDRPNAENREFLNRSIDRPAAKIGSFGAILQNLGLAQNWYRVGGSPVRHGCGC
jgi:hypothetical protein